jgi:pyruvate ferredoxin oxidoreductase alpha subunit
MYELLYVAASCRLPVILACVNRALSGPINIGNDHSDSMGARDAGWIQLYAENNQEAYDNFCMAMRIGEHPDVRLPVMTCQDGFITSHAIENIELLEDSVIKAFVGEYNPGEYLLKQENPLSVGPYDTAAYYLEHKYQQAEAMRNAKQVVLKIAEEFKGISGRDYGLFEKYRMDDAEKAIILIGSSAGTAKVAVNNLRSKGEKVGLIKLRVFRPFPMEELAVILGRLKAVAVLDKSDSFSASGGPLFKETRSACYGIENAPLMINYIYGLGGRDLQVPDIEIVYGQLSEILLAGNCMETYRYLGVRGI